MAETSASHLARRPPQSSEAPTGSSASTAAAAVRMGLYQSIMPSAPTKPASSMTRVKTLAR